MYLESYKYKREQRKWGENMAEFQKQNLKMDPQIPCKCFLFLHATLVILKKNFAMAQGNSRGPMSENYAVL